MSVATEPLAYPVGCMEGLRKEMGELGPPGSTTALTLQCNQNLSEGSEAEILATILAELPGLKELNLSSCSLGGASLRALAPGLQHLDELEKLVLSFNHLDVAGASALDEPFAHLVKLKELTLSNCCLTAASIHEFACGLSHLTELEILHLGGNDIGAKGACVLADSVFVKTAKLKHLGLSAFVSVDGNAARHFSRGFAHLAALEVLDASCCGLDASSMPEFASGLGSLARLRRLKLRNNNLGAAGAAALATKALPHLAGMRDFDASFCALDAAALQGLAPGLAHLRLLETLALAGNGPGCEGLRALAAVALPSLTALSELDLSHSVIDGPAIKELAPGLQHVRGLRVLRLAGNEFGTEGAQALGAEGLSYLAGLRVLDLRHCDFTRPSVEAMVPHISQLSDLESIEFADRKAMGQFVRALSFGKEAWRPRLPRIRALDLENSGMNPTFLAQTVPSIRHLASLEALNLKGNDMGTRGSAALAEECLPHLGELRDLNITDCGVSALAMEVLAPSLAGLAKLERLSIRGNEFGPDGTGKLAADVLPHLAGLRELVLAHCELGAEPMAELVKGLRHCTRLEKLVLAFNEFEAAGAQALGSTALPQLRGLKELNLSACGLDEAAVQDLVPSLQDLANLERLVFTSNELGAEGARALAAGVFPRLMALRELEIAYCGIDEAGMQDIASGLGNMRGLERLNVMGNAVGTEGARALAAVLPRLAGLRDLNMSYARVDAAGLRELAPALRALPGLEVLSLRNNKLGEEGARALAEGPLPDLQRLRTLDLRVCALDRGAVEVLAPALAQLGSLGVLELGDKKLLLAFVLGLAKCSKDHVTRLGMFKELCLDRSGITADALREMVPGLLRLGGLELLSLRANEFGSEGTEVLAAVLPQMARLKQLHLASCEIPAAAMKGLVQALGQLLDLESLNLMGNEVDAGGVDALVSVAIPRLARLKDLNVMGCNISDEGRTALEEAIRPAVAITS